MFGNNKDKLCKVLNPLGITKDSIVEFSSGMLADSGIYRFKKIIELEVGEKKFVRYLLYSRLNDTQYILEIFPKSEENFESYVYRLADTIPFSEEFLGVAGQKYLTTPDQNEYTRSIMPETAERIDGISGNVRVYDVASDEIQKQVDVRLWDYSRETDDSTEFLNLEMMGDTGLFRIFIGEKIEDIFYKIYIKAD